MTCPYFGSCGGCSSQHISYDVQLQNKQQLLERVLKQNDASVPVKVFSGQPFGYRNRMDFVFSDKGLALREKGRWQNFIPVKACPISNEGVNRLLQEVQEWFLKTKPDVFNIRTHQGTFRYCVIRHAEHTEDGSLSFVLNADSSRLKEANDFITAFSSMTTAKNVCIAHVPAQTDVSISEESFAIKGGEELVEDILGKPFSYHVQGFFQNNTLMAEQMVSFVREVFAQEQTEDATLLDLYGGVGLFGISLADTFRHIHILENFAGSITSANKNAEFNGATVHAIVADAVNAYKLHLGKPLHVITDPPRSGMHPKAIERLIGMQPEMIIYISCNPEQLGRELHWFLKRYTVVDAALFDLFPQTLHVETIVVLKKS